MKIHLIIYLWNIKDTNVYKIGVTSKRRGLSRIKEVAKKHNLEYILLAYSEVKDAFGIENKLHKKFNKGQKIVNNGDGSTEFRTLNYNEVSEILDYIKRSVLG